MEPASLADRLAAVGALDEPSRRELYRVVSQSSAPVSRDEAAVATGLSRATAAFHLDRLVAEGLLTVEYRRLSGRTGPGAGRPSKLYRRTDAEISVTLPERHYDLAAELLAQAVETSVATGEPASDVLPRLAVAAGEEIGASAGSLQAALIAYGFEPRDDGAGGLILGNCPFHRLAKEHVSLVCGLNSDLLRGVVAGSDDREYTVCLDPGPDRCCVRAVRRAS